MGVYPESVDKCTQCVAPARGIVFVLDGENGPEGYRLNSIRRECRLIGRVVYSGAARAVRTKFNFGEFNTRFKEEFKPSLEGFFNEMDLILDFECLELKKKLSGSLH
ncbi:hypothetical protein NPIL_543111 [Nephila pilipes]|uniref:Uncharacterized protein n=1 Tax=Nephila pilipes TaxID=299642 RepID=A0A8X6U9J9_NEPPI|nr:hypothetical protein NPIL_543111 [Nephila pilipes]